MDKEIYYFSGSGNSLVVARDMANKINAKLIPIISLSNQKDINTNAEILGFVFPIYGFKQPRLVEEFVKKIKNIHLKYIFALCTYGIVPAKSLKIFDQSIRSCGGKLSLGFAVQMPHNGLGSSLFSQAEREIMFKGWKSKLEVISKYITDGKQGKLETSGLFSNPAFWRIIIKTLPLVIKLLSRGLSKGWKSLALISNEKCDGCGICKKICPADNIEMVDNKPSWLNHCMSCNACFHWCPKDAIQFGNTNMHIKQYHHPEAKIVDILKQKGNVNY